MTLILALDTTAAHCGVALVSGSDVLISRTDPMTKGQAERLFPIIDEIMSECGLSYSDLDAIAVATGPGNFTGVRICVSAARGLGVALKVPVVGVSVLEALAFGHDGLLLATVDARGGTVYSQLFLNGMPQEKPVHSKIDEIHWDGENLRCVGHMADQLSSQLKATFINNELPKPESYGRIAQLRDLQRAERPTPLYIRDADAALPSEAPPVIVP